MLCTYLRISHVDFKEMPDWGLCDQHCQVGLDKYGNWKYLTGL